MGVCCDAVKTHSTLSGLIYAPASQAGTAVAAFFIDFNVDLIVDYKFGTVKGYMTNQSLDASRRT